jgi:hypothetical protein
VGWLLGGREGMQVQENVRWKNLNSLERIEHKKIRIPRDDMGGTTRNREFKEFVVLRIAASCYPHIDVNPLSIPRQSREKKSDIFFIHISTETLSAEDLVDFGENRG